MLNEPCKECGCGYIDWADRYCQACWESLCNREWWLMIARLDTDDDEYPSDPDDYPLVALEQAALEAYVSQLGDRQGGGDDA